MSAPLQITPRYVRRVGASCLLLALALSASLQAQDAREAPAVKREAAKKAAAEDEVKKAGELHKAQREERARKDAEQVEALRAKRAAEQDAKAEGAGDKLDDAALRA